MKKAIALIISLMMLCCLFTACGEGKETEAFDPEEELKDRINADVAAECVLGYKDVKLAMTTITDIQVDEEIYTAKGKVTITDDYGDKYVGKVTGEYRYNEGTQKFTKVDLEIETPRKQS